jgi:tRNA uridine 5-carboxymethylaminomethyl modification enzyme
LAVSLGLVDDRRWDAFNRKRDAVARESERLKATWVNPRQLPEADALRVLGQPMEREYRLFDLLRRPQVTYAERDVLAWSRREPVAVLRSGRAG